MGSAGQHQRPEEALPARSIWLAARDALYAGPMENLEPDDSVRCARCRTTFAIGDAFVRPERSTDPRSWYCPTESCGGELGDFVPVG